MVVAKTVAVVEVLVEPAERVVDHPERAVWV
jgi:hypothetical protein